jgi:hypothetical protein
VAQKAAADAQKAQDKASKKAAVAAQKVAADAQKAQDKADKKAWWAKCEDCGRWRVTHSINWAERDFHCGDNKGFAANLLIPRHIILMNTDCSGRVLHAPDDAIILFLSQTISVDTHCRFQWFWRKRRLARRLTKNGSVR